MISIISKKSPPYLKRPRRLGRCQWACLGPVKVEEDIVDFISQSNKIISLGWSVGQRNNGGIIQKA